MISCINFWSLALSLLHVNPTMFFPFMVNYWDNMTVPMTLKVNGQGHGASHPGYLWQLCLSLLFPGRNTYERSFVEPLGNNFDRIT